MQEFQERKLLDEFRKLPTDAKAEVLRYLKRLTEGKKKEPHLRLVNSNRAS